MNRFLLMAGYNHYPSHGTGDWVKTYPTHSEARAVVSEFTVSRTITHGKKKGQIEKISSGYKIQEPNHEHDIYDWYEIVDLQDWL